MKSFLKLFTFLCLLASLSSLFSCGNNCKEDYIFYSDYKLFFMVLDEKTGENLLEIGSNRYFQDTVEIFDKNLKPLGIHPSLDGMIGLGFLTQTRDLNEPLNTPLEHTYYVYFEEGDYDTLSIGYHIGLDECSEKILTQWSVSYNDSLYINYSSNPPNSKIFNFLKSSPKRK